MDTTTMDTTTAAERAGVTIATIRTWCRRRAVAAIKVAGRWVIEASSLAYRISLGKKTKTVIEPLTRAAYQTAAGSGAVKDARCHKLHRIYSEAGTDEWGDAPTELDMLAIRRGAALAAQGYTQPAAKTGPGYAPGLPGQIFGGPAARAGECHYCGLPVGRSGECDDCR